MNYRLNAQNRDAPAFSIPMNKFLIVADLLQDKAKKSQKTPADINQAYAFQ
jgi:hypothetical protein